jgi:hypothetical protein
MAAGFALALAGPTMSAMAGSSQQPAEASGAAEQAAPPHGGSGQVAARYAEMMGGGQHGPGSDAQQQFLRMCAAADAQHAAILAFAESRLRITDAQRPAWTKFTQAENRAQQALNQPCVGLKDQPEPTTLPERLARAEEFVSAHLAHLQALRPAVDELYQQLTPEQRQTADRFSPDMPSHQQELGHHPSR